MVHQRSLIRQKCIEVGLLSDGVMTLLFYLKGGRGGDPTNLRIYCFNSKMMGSYWSVE
jgi:hypothetical protein